MDIHLTQLLTIHTDTNDICIAIGFWPWVAQHHYLQALTLLLCHHEYLEHIMEDFEAVGIHPEKSGVWPFQQKNIPHLWEYRFAAATVRYNIAVGKYTSRL